MSSSAFDRLRALLGNDATGTGLHLGQLEFYNNAPEIDLASLRLALQNYPRMSAQADEKLAYLASLGIEEPDMTPWLARCEPTSGSRNGLFALMLQAHLDDGHQSPLCYLLPSPGYPAYEDIARYFAAEVRFYSADTPQLIHALCAMIHQERQKRFCLILCNPLMPQSRSLAPEGTEELLALTRTHNVQLIIDECYRDFAAPDAPRFPLACLRDPGFDDCALTVLHSLSKRSGLPGLRSGFAIGSLRTIHALRRYNQVAGTRGNRYFTALAADAWRTSHPHILSQVKENWQLVQEILAEFLPVNYGREGMFLWLPVAHDERFTRALWQRYAIKVMPGSYLSADGSGRHYVRIALNQPASQMRGCLNNIATLLAEDHSLSNHKDTLKEYL